MTKTLMKTGTITFEEISAREEEFQLATYKKFPFAPVRGRGCWVETSEGERFLDLYGGHAVCATGHCHPRVVEALREQSGRLLFYSNVVYSTCAPTRRRSSSLARPAKSRRRSSATRARRPTRTLCAWR